MSISGAGGNKVIVVALGDNLTVDSFGAFGTGSSPASPGELDTLQFTGAGMTAPNLVLNQVGADVVVTFDGITGTSVTLTNLTIEQLENIAGQVSRRAWTSGAQASSPARCSMPTTSPMPTISRTR